MKIFLFIVLIVEICLMTIFAPNSTIRTESQEDTFIFMLFLVFITSIFIFRKRLLILMKQICRSKISRYGVLLISISLINIILSAFDWRDIFRDLNYSLNGFLYKIGLVDYYPRHAIRPIFYIFIFGIILFTFGKSLQKILNIIHKYYILLVYWLKTGHKNIS